MISSIKQDLEKWREYSEHTPVESYYYNNFFKENTRLLRRSAYEQVIEKELSELVKLWFVILNKWTNYEVLEIDNYKTIYESAYIIHQKLNKLDEAKARGFVDRFLNEKISVFDMLNRVEKKEDDLSIEASFAQIMAMTDRPFQANYINISEENGLSNAAYKHFTLKDKVKVSRIGIAPKEMSIHDLFSIICPDTHITLYCVIAPTAQEAAYYVLNRMPENKASEIIEIFEHFKLNTLEAAMQIQEFVKLKQLYLKQIPINTYDNFNWKEDELNQLERHATVIYEKEILNKNILPHASDKNGKAPNAIKI